MTISYNNSDEVIIKTKTESITVGDGVKIGGYHIATAGEYDVAAIQCEAQYLATATAYFLRTEELTVTYLTHVDQEVVKLDDASNTDILILDVKSDDKTDEVKSIIKGLEPSYLFLLGSGNTAELQQNLGLPSLESATLKVTRSSLPHEGTSLVPTN